MAARFTTLRSQPSAGHSTWQIITKEFGRIATELQILFIAPFSHSGAGIVGRNYQWEHILLYKIFSQGLFYKLKFQFSQIAPSPSIIAQ